MDELCPGEKWHHSSNQTKQVIKKSSLCQYVASRNLVDKYHPVFVTDCTHKTNRYGVPLLHIVEMTPLNQSYSASVIFVTEEKVGDIWALNKFKNITLLPGKLPACLVIDREVALINAMNFFPRGSSLSCLAYQ